MDFNLRYLQEAVGTLLRWRAMVTRFYVLAKMAQSNSHSQAGANDHQIQVTSERDAIEDEMQKVKTTICAEIDRFQQ